MSWQVVFTEEGYNGIWSSSFSRTYVLDRWKIAGRLPLHLFILFWSRNFASHTATRLTCLPSICILNAFPSVSDGLAVFIVLVSTYFSQRAYREIALLSWQQKMCTLVSIGYYYMLKWSSFKSFTRFGKPFTDALRTSICITEIIA